MTKIVTLFNGESAERSECRYIKGKFYKINRDVFKIDGTWYRINSPLVDRDYETGEIFLKDPSKESSLQGSLKRLASNSSVSRIKGIVACSGNEYTLGYFTPNKFKNAEVVKEDGVIIKALNPEILIKNGYIELHKTGFFIHPLTNQKYAINAVSRRINDVRGKTIYRIADSIKELRNDFNNFGLVTSKYSSGEYNKYIGLSKLLKPFTFGMEFETSFGTLPERYLYQYGIAPLRDGSIQGIEYTTIPYTHQEIIPIVYELAPLLQKFTDFELDCAFHVHIGGFPKTYTNIVALYTLICALQDNLYSFFPDYVRNTSKVKRQDYNSPLDSALIRVSPEKYKTIEDIILAKMRNIYYYYSGGSTFDALSDAEHPNDRDNSRKWQVSARYKLINLIPLIFGKYRTVEFRMHTPTFDKVKIINWIFIATAILKYANKYSKELSSNPIEKITLEKVLADVYPSQIAGLLISYFTQRREDFLNWEKSDIKCLQDFKEDSKNAYDKFNLLNLKY